MDFEDLAGSPARLLTIATTLGVVGSAVLFLARAWNKSLAEELDERTERDRPHDRQSDAAKDLSRFGLFLLILAGGAALAAGVWALVDAL